MIDVRNSLVRLAYGAFATPVRIRDRLYCLNLRRHCTIGADSDLTPTSVIHNSMGREAVRIGSGTLFMGEALVIAPSGKIEIGDSCFVGPNAKVWSMEKISIGSRVNISHGVQIFDNNSHSLSASERSERFMELRKHGRHLVPEAVTHGQIRIEDDVWIGFNAAILKGVTIGRGAVIGACAVVTHDVPPYAVMVGNPARQVGESRP